jgi:hypothetical protein
MERNVPAGSKVVVEPIVPDAWFTDPGSLRDRSPAELRGIAPSGRRWIKFPTGRTLLDTKGRPLPGGKAREIRVEDYERILRPALIGSYARGGYCWVMIGSTQYGRAFRSPGEVPDAVRYYRDLGRRGQVVFRADPYADGAPPHEFNFDWSFDYYPLSYERPGPTVIVYRLREAACRRPGNAANAQ